MKNLILSENKKESIWLSPAGKFFSVLNSLSKSETKQLKNDGWLRLIFEANDLFVCNEVTKTYNSFQENELINFAIEISLESIIFDNGQKEKIIWSESDKI